MPKLKAVAAIFKLSSTAYNRILSSKDPGGAISKYMHHLQARTKQKIQVVPGKENEVSVVFLIPESQHDQAVQEIQKEFHTELITAVFKLASTDVRVEPVQPGLPGAPTPPSLPS